jgi:hypothetical protein
MTTSIAVVALGLAVHFVPFKVMLADGATDMVVLYESVTSVSAEATYSAASVTLQERALTVDVLLGVGSSLSSSPHAHSSGNAMAAKTHNSFCFIVVVMFFGS